MTTFVDKSTEDAVTDLFSASDFTDDLHLYLGLDPAVSSANQPIDVEGLLRDALSIAEQDQWRSILSKDVTLSLPYRAFCANDNKIYLPYGQVNSITSFTYQDADSADQTLTEGTDFTLYSYEPAYLWAENWFNLMDLNSTEPEVVSIVYNTGYTAFNQVPRSTLSALKIMCYHLFNSRDDTNKSDITPMAYRHTVTQAMANSRRCTEFA